MFTRKTISVLAIVLMAAASASGQESPKKVDPLAAVEVLEGVWQGEGQGFGQTSKVTHEWGKVLGGKFMRLKARSATGGKTEPGSVHEDVGYVSWSESEGILRFRQFLSEGFVNTFRVERVEGPKPGFNFEPESTEGEDNLVARMTLRFEQPAGYEMIVELGTKGKPLKACQTMRLRKVR